MRLAIPLISFVLAFSASAQTRIAPPAAKINLAELGQVNKKQVKRLKRLDRYKEQKAKLIRKQLKKHTGYSKEELDAYASMVKGLDSMQMEDFGQTLDKVIEEQDAQNASHVARIREEQKKGQEWKTRVEAYRQDSLSLRDYQPNLTQTALALVQDSLRNLASQQVAYGVGVDSLNKLSVDSAAVLSELQERSGVKVDTSYLSYRRSQPSLPTYDTLLNPSVNTDSLVVTSLQNPVESFMKSFAQERLGAQELGLPDGQAQVPTVRQFIPEFENFDYVKPVIPEEKLTKALIEQEKEKRKERLKEAVVPKLQRGETEQEVNWIERWKVGGYVEYKPENRLIELTPTLAYGILEKISIGVGYSTVVALDRNSQVDKQIAYRAFLDYLLINSFYLHAESEWKEQRSIEMPTLKERSTLLGLGRNFQYKSISTSILALFNLSAPNTIDTRRFSVRFAVNFNP